LRDCLRTTAALSGVAQVLEDEFNCLSPWSDAGQQDCAELRFVTPDGDQLAGAFKPPSLRNVDQTAPYMHAGQFETLERVLLHYNHPPSAPLGHSELEPLGLTTREQSQLVAFLRALSGGVAGGGWRKRQVDGAGLQSGVYNPPCARAGRRSNGRLCGVQWWSFCWRWLS
jgi:cytochrome c peroxidase